MASLEMWANRFVHGASLSPSRCHAAENGASLRQGPGATVADRNTFVRQIARIHGQEHAAIIVMHSRIERHDRRVSHRIDVVGPCPAELSARWRRRQSQRAHRVAGCSRGKSLSAE